MGTLPAWSDATNETAPWHLWRYAVLAVSDATAADGRAHAEKLTRWYQAGEPVWMAADGLRQLVRGARLAKQADRDTLRNAILAGMRAKCANESR